MQLFFVGGASGSGKTAIMPKLKNQLTSSHEIYDFDDIGIPSNADTKWRQQTTEKWLDRLLNDGKNSCLLGQIVLGEILACPSAKKISCINFCFLDVNDQIRISRLRKRNTYGADQNMLNWSSWLRMHHHDPTWEQHVIKNNSWDHADFSSWDKTTKWKNKVKFIDNSNLTIEETAKQVADWVQQLQTVKI